MTNKIFKYLNIDYRKMVAQSYLIVVGLFLVYYLALLIKERKLIRDPGEIIGKFLAMILLYAGISIVYFSFTGRTLFGESPETYNIYIFIIGFIAILWTVPELLEEFSGFNKFFEKKKKKRKS